MSLESDLLRVGQLRVTLAILQDEYDDLRGKCLADKPHDHGLLRAVEMVTKHLQKKHDRLVMAREKR